MNDRALPDPTATSLAEQLLAEHFGRTQDQLCVDGHRVETLLERFGSPLFVYRAQAMRSALHQLRRATHDQVDVHYSVKANPNPAVIRLFADQGAGAEVASAAEYVLAQRAGIAAKRIVFAGPAKSESELAHVLSHGIGEIHLESEHEISRLTELTRRLGCRVQVAIRVNPTAHALGGSMRMGGRPAPFGFDEEDLAAVAARIEAAAGLDLVGVHMFAGTQILDADVLLGQWAHGLAVAERLAAQIGRPLTTIDLGGGLGIPYFKSERALDLERLREGVPQLLARKQASRLLREARLIVEPGRFLAGPAGLYLSRVNAIKRSRDETFVITDGGMHHHLAASGNLGQVIKKDFPVLLANRLTPPPSMAATVCGPLCTPLDVLSRRTLLPPTQVNDIVCVMQSGAYALSASPNGFLSHPTPAEVLVDGAEIRVIRQRGCFERPYRDPEPDFSPPRRVSDEC
ncbi:MAG: type III PLP-dependent enzyme [Burkholderiaceae bacterium]